jgi:ketosteroid isomerase-like protein
MNPGGVLRPPPSSLVAVSKDDLEIVRRAYECVNSGDWERMAELVDPDVEQPGTVGGLEESNLAHGLSEIRQLYENDEEAWGEYRIDPEKVIDAVGKVVVFQREYQRGRSSGIEIVTETAAIIYLCDGRIVRIQGYLDRAAALEAAGLSTQDAPR